MSLRCTPSKSRHLHPHSIFSDLAAMNTSKSEQEDSPTIDFVSFGMVIIDEIRLPSCPPLLDVTGGSGAFCTSNPKARIIHLTAHATQRHLDAASSRPVRSRTGRVSRFDVSCFLPNKSQRDEISTSKWWTAIRDPITRSNHAQWFLHPRNWFVSSRLLSMVNMCP